MTGADRLEDAGMEERAAPVLSRLGAWMARFAIRVVMVATLGWLIVVILIFIVLPGEGLGIGRYGDHRFALLAHLLKVGVLLVAGMTLVSLLGALLLRPASVRTAVRKDAQKLSEASAESLAGVLTRLAGRAALWLTNSSLQVQAFAGAVEKVDAAGVSSALAGFLPEIGSPTRIGQAGPIDLRRETAAFGATTVAGDIEKALSEAPYGKAATALLALADRLLPRDRLFVNGYILDSAQKGLGLTITLSRDNGRIIRSEVIWSGDFDPAIVSGIRTTRETAAAPLTLALVGAVWLTFEMAERGGQRDVGSAFGTASWQAFALVRVGLQGGLKRPVDLTRAIYARAIEADSEKRLEHSSEKPPEQSSDKLDAQPDDYLTARYNLALAQLRSDSYQFGPLFERARETLRQLREQLSSDEDALGFSVVFNEAIAVINHYRPDALDRDERRDEVAVSRNAMHSSLQRLEKALAAGRDVAILSQLEAPMLGLWASLDLVSDTSFAADAQCPTVLPISREELRSALENDTLTRDQAVAGYLKARPVDARTRYNLACYWSRRGTLKTALEELAISLEVGTVGGGAATDPGLAALRDGMSSEFQQLMSTYNVNAALGSPPRI